MAASILQASTFLVDGTNATTYEVTRPAGLTNGNTLVMAVCVDGGGRTITMTADGLAELGEISGSTTINVGYLKIDGTEPTTFTITISSTETIAAVVYEIENAADPDVTPPEQTGTTGASTTPDPPSHTPSGGSDDYLWLAFAGMDVDTTTRTLDNYPSNMTHASPAEQEAIGTTTISCGMAGDAHAANASSFDPNTFGINESDAWAAVTISISPGASAPAYTQLSFRGRNDDGVLTEPV